MRSYLSLLLPATVAILAAKVARADDTFAGCFYDDDNTWREATTDTDTPDACSEQCKSEDLDYTYSGYMADYSPSCYCAYNYEASNEMSNGNAGACPAYNFDVRVVDTSFYLVGCYTDVVYEEVDQGQFFTTDGPQGCFDSCASDYEAVFYQSNNQYLCNCAGSSLESLSGSTTCGPSANFVYAHTAGAQASGLTRRRLRDRLQLAKRKLSAYCPNDQTACKVFGSETDYECIDTVSDLESCGGCIFGQYDKPTAPLGQDCTASGAAWGGATCVNGQCAISACRAPLKLVNGQCIA